MNVHAEGNRLFFDDVEVWEFNSGREGTPAHFQEILCVGLSPKGTRIVSVDKTGDLKVWDPSLPNTNQRVWKGQGFAGATALGVTEDGERLAVAIGMEVTVYDLAPNQPAKKLEDALLVCERIASLRFTDSNHVVCNLGEVIFRRNPAWTTSS